VSFLESVLAPQSTTADMSTSSSLKPSTWLAIALGTTATAFVAYAIYFDYKRQTDPEFRKELKRESKRTAKAAKAEAEASATQQRKKIREAVDKVNESDLPKDSEEAESYFMQEVAHGEELIQSSMHTSLKETMKAMVR
jgi:mitochondrial import receptor subunit TOM20